MSIELPILRLGLAGFSAEQQGELAVTLQSASSGNWRIVKFPEADAWCIAGRHVQVLPDGTIRVAAGMPGGRSVHLDLKDVDRPVAFALPLPSRQFNPTCTFDASSKDSVSATLERFEAWLQPMVAQFCLASCILEQERVLGPGIHHVHANGTLIAVVNMRGEVGVLPTIDPIDFEDAKWTRLALREALIPEHFARASLSQLMWQFVGRTNRDVLPERYRTSTVYFRRPPHLPQRLLTDSHLLLLRELAGAPGDFKGLQQRTGLSPAELACDLAALYFVGAITTNARRAAVVPSGRSAAEVESTSGQGSVSSGLDPHPVSLTRSAQPLGDLTAPAPLGPHPPTK